MWEAVSEGLRQENLDLSEELHNWEVKQKDHEKEISSMTRRCDWYRAELYRISLILDHASTVIENLLK